MSYKVYQGELITFKIKDKNELLCKSLIELIVDIDDKGLFILDKKTNTNLGYVDNFTGIDIEDFCKFFNLKLETEERN